MDKLHPGIKVILGIIIATLIFYAYSHSTPDRLLTSAFFGGVRSGTIVYQEDFSEGRIYIIREVQTNPAFDAYRIYFTKPSFGLWKININGSNSIHTDGSRRITADRLPNYPDNSLYVVWGGIIDDHVDQIRFMGNFSEIEIEPDPSTGLFVILGLDSSEFDGSEDDLFARIIPISFSSSP